jgi:uncharacterized OB-fold protein
MNTFQKSELLRVRRVFSHATHEIGRPFYNGYNFEARCKKCGRGVYLPPQGQFTLTFEHVKKDVYVSLLDECFKNKNS